MQRGRKQVENIRFTMHIRLWALFDFDGQQLYKVVREKTLPAVAESAFHPAVKHMLLPVSEAIN
jgi:hypothetical protein